MTVGEILTYLKGLPANMKTRWYFQYPCSYRGYYDQVAVMVGSGYESSVADAIMVMSSCLDTFEGWKGGSSTMDVDTPVWVAAPGSIGFPLTFGFLALMLSNA